MKTQSPSQSETGILSRSNRLYCTPRVSKYLYRYLMLFAFVIVNTHASFCNTIDDSTCDANKVTKVSFNKSNLHGTYSFQVPCFNLICTDLTINLNSGECGIILDFFPEIENICGGTITIMPLDTTLYKFGQILPIGFHQICFIGTDQNGISETCCMNVTINPVTNPIGSLVCNSEVQVSLNENCLATIGADEILTGGPYRCFKEYVVEIRDWYTNALIDRDLILDGPQVGKDDIGKQLRVTIRDTFFKNSCWGKLTVEDKLPPVLICPPDVTYTCGYSGSTPDCTGTPFVSDNCGSYSLTYYDDVRYGDCAKNYQELIHRVWMAVDESGNKSSCTQEIIIEFASLTQVYMPDDFDDFDNPSFACDEKINTTQNYASHFLPYPHCVDGYLLDSAHWIATGERIPRTLGWNCLDSGKYAGNPSPIPVFYPSHPEWSATFPTCWGPDQVVMWMGTGIPNGSQCLNLNLNYQDLKIDLAKPNCDAGSIGCFKILRQWTVLDWCTGQIGGSNQIIKVIDKKAPAILFIDSVLVNMDEWSCTGKFEVPKPWLTDNCSNDLHYYVTVENGFVLGDDQAGYVITNIQPGIWNAYIVAEDCCGNVARWRFVINAQDNVPPSPVCDRVTIVSLVTNPNTGESFGQIYAKDLDQSSYDNCAKHLFFKVIRMEQLRGTNNGSAINQTDNGTNCTKINGDDQLNANGNQIYFDDYVRFCCNDVGKTIRVVLRVFDRETPSGPINPGRMSNNSEFAGHYADCMIDVEVQDKTIPTVQAPPDIVVSCWFWFDIEKIDDPNDATFGRVVTDFNQRKKVITNDLVCHTYCLSNDITGYPGYIPGASPSNPPASNKACNFYNVLFDTSHYERKYDLTWGFDGTVLAACGAKFSINVNDNRECGQGRITRTILATGPNGVNVSATQTIWVVDCDPFYINRDDRCDPYDDITWPGNCNGQATTIQSCGADISPDNPLLGRPKIENNADDLCSLISTEYVDEIFTIEVDACFKVLRKWVVIDWCQYDPLISPTNGRWEYLQVIKVHDIVKPVVGIALGDCEPAFKKAVDNICYGHLEISAEASDNCSPQDWLFFEYKIDLYNDGKGVYSGFDYAVGPLAHKELIAGKKPYRHDNPLAENANDPFAASGSYPIGIHKICWFVEDGCGNVTMSCKLFEIKDCKDPTAYCLNGIITTVMPSSGCITIWARDLDIGSFDNCTDQKDLHFFFEYNNADSLTICCDEFIRNKVNVDLTIPVKVCVEDEEGNKDCCRTFVLIQDPQNVCPDIGSNARIGGSINTMMSTNTKNVNVQLLESGNLKKEFVTGDNGQYLFGDLAFGAAKEYVIRPSRIDDPLNGVSTADIVKIQRHILGQENLPSPYQWIAADVNKSLSITAADVSEIRKLILGITSKFDKVDSWTFVPKDYNMDLKYPWKTPREITVPVPAPQELIKDFVSIKMGDVNNSAIANNASGVISRNQGILQFEIDSHVIAAGEVYKLDFSSANFENISGYQFTLKFDHEVLNYEGFESGALSMNESNFGFQKINEGLLTTSWNTKSGQTVERNTTLFTLLFRANKNVNVSDILSINSQITKAEAYDKQLNIKDVSLSVMHQGQSNESNVFELYQNTPNPFNKETVIHFVLPQSGAAQMSIYDVSGKIMFTEDINGRKGWNSIKITREKLQTTGVYYYQLNAGEYTSTKRMVVE